MKFVKQINSAARSSFRQLIWKSRAAPTKPKSRFVCSDVTSQLLRFPVCRDQSCLLFSVCLSVISGQAYTITLVLVSPCCLPVRLIVFKMFSLFLKPYMVQPVSLSLHSCSFAIRLNPFSHLTGGGRSLVPSSQWLHKDSDAFCKTVDPKQMNHPLF